MVKKKRQSEVENDDSTTESCDETTNMNNNQNVCRHIKKAVDVSKIRKAIKAEGALLTNCSECLKENPSPITVSESPDMVNNKNYDEIDKSLWFCLKCGSQLCGRSRNQHALKHFQVFDCKTLFFYFYNIQYFSDATI